MRKNKPVDVDYPVASRCASEAVMDPTRRLGLGVVIRAAKECHDANWIDALDALLFVLDPYGAPMWLDALGWPGEPDVVFRRLLDGKTSRQIGKLAPE